MSQADFQLQYSKKHFFNRELSWIEFNARVLGEGLRTENPLLERLKFLCIASSNFDEFFMIRIGALKRQLEQNSSGICPTRMSPSEQMEMLRNRIRELVYKQYDEYLTQIRPGLKDHGLSILDRSELEKDDREFVSHIFENEIFPILSPIRVEKNFGYPLSGNHNLKIAVLLQPEQRSRKKLLAFVPIPKNLPRFYFLSNRSKQKRIVLIEDIILLHIERLFVDQKIIEHSVVRVTRDADLSVDEEQDENFLDAMKEVLVRRQHSFPLRLEIQPGKKAICEELRKHLKLEDEDVYEIFGPLHLASMMSLCFHPDFAQLRFPEWKSSVPEALSLRRDIWKSIAKKDVLLHHPFHSFNPVIRFVQEAADDPFVQSIKMTIYRASGNSPIVESLIRAVQSGKQVTVLVELKARFDEQQNIRWADKLKTAGAVVIYGISNLKVHSKTILVVRREPNGIKRYAHLGTGNYNEKTAALYTDVSILTAREDLCHEAGLFFNVITGYSTVSPLKILSVAPFNIKRNLIRMIDREIARHSPQNPGLIMAKANALGDPDIINALYKASRAGVVIKLCIRGVCMLVPGVQGQSETIEIHSIVGRYLEHHRIYYFQNGGDHEVFLSSADLMPRNLDRRIELMVPIVDRTIIDTMIQILKSYFKDNQQGHKLLPTGVWEKIKNNKAPFSAQDAMQQLFGEQQNRRGLSFLNRLEVLREID